MGFGVVWSVLAAPVCVLMVHGASTSNQSDGCSNGTARLVSGSDSSNFSAALNELGDGRGFIEICHMENWMRPCGPSDGMWTIATTTVACRERGYTAAASFGVYRDQHIGPSRILPYFPDCEGNEESLDDCDRGNDPTDDCLSPVVISCWNNSAVTSKPLSPSITQTAYTALGSSRLPATHSIPEPTSSRVPVAPSLETYMSSSLTQPAVTSLPQPAVTSLPQPAVTSLPPPSSKVLVSVAGAVGGVVLLQLAAIVAVLLLLCQRRQRVKPQDQPPSLPNGGRNATFEMEEVPEFEALYDRTTAIPPPLEAEEFHTLTHSPATQPSHPHTVPAAYETVAPSSSRGNPVRDAPREKPPVYYHVLEHPRERVADHKYHTLEQVGPTRAVEPMYSEVAPRRAATLGSQKPRPSTPPPPSALTLPQNLSGSMTLL